MKNSDMPAMPQEREWQNDMEIHLTQPEKGGNPPAVGIGLTKREHFAAMAMQGMYANLGEICGRMSVGESLSESIAARAVIAAEALLAELERTK